MKKIHSFPKNEHLCGEIRVAKLYTEGNAFIAYPIRVVYNITDEKTNARVKVLISVPKKRFKHAVDRNRIKRMLREAYRLNKQEFVMAATEKDLYLNIAFNYVADTELEYAVLNEKMQQALTKIRNKINF
ncbi:MAG: ribonuclease P protein component [Paludibacter sp.]